MKLMVGIFLTLLMTQAANAEILGFRTWKSKQIEEAKISLDVAKIDLRVKNTGGKSKHSRYIPVASPRLLAAKKNIPDSKRAQSWEERLNQAKLNLEIAQELTVNDYFVLYLSRVDNPDVFEEAAKKMTPEEMAELMRAYRSYIDRAKSGDEVVVDQPFVGRLNN